MSEPASISSSREHTAFGAFDELQDNLRQGKLGDFQAKSDYAACLMPLLQALGWKRDIREIAEALPHFANSLNRGEFRNVLARLGYKTTSVIDNVSFVDPRVLPCLFILDGGGACVLLHLEGHIVRLFDGVTGRERTVKANTLQGTLYLVTPEEKTEVEEKARKDNWMGELSRRFSQTMKTLMGLTFVLNFLTLLVPLFVMAVYDQVIPSKSLGTLGYLMAGMVLVFIIEASLRVVRSRIVAYLGGRVETIVATNAFRQIISLPAAMTESAPLGNQVARIKEFDSIRELFVGPLSQVLLEIPFTLLFIIVIAIIGKWLALVPIAMIIIFTILGMFLLPSLKRAVSFSGVARSKRHGFLVETVINLRTIKESRSEDTWLERYKTISAEASYHHFKTSQITFLFQTFAQTIMMVAGLATISLGVTLVIKNEMTVGALIATMALVWRVLAPLHSLFLTLSRLEQIKLSIHQVNVLMKMKTEAEMNDKSSSSLKRRYRGAITFSRLSFRYNPTSEPALLGINLEIKPGDMVAVTGANGAGKSTFLRMILGLHNPQAGQVTLDGMDLRQINPLELRQTIAYVPQVSSMFHGTIAQNLRLSNPISSDRDLQAACSLAGLMDDINNLERGFETRIGDQNTRQLNSGFLQRLSLARAYLRRAPIILMDEAAQTLDDEGDKAFISALKKIKGSSTIIMISHRPSHMKIADRLIVLSAGLMVLDGPPIQVMDKLAGAS